jgi:hypothetical protein
MFLFGVHCEEDVSRWCLKSYLKVLDFLVNILLMYKVSNDIRPAFTLKYCVTGLELRGNISGQSLHRYIL